MPETNILIVEDESIVALDLQKRLESMGYNVLGPVSSGSAAIDSATGLQPDIVLMDIRLQGKMDGISAAQVIQHMHAIPVVYLTAHSDTTTLVRAKQTQPYGYLVKPFNERELHTTIEMALYRHNMEKQAQRQTQQLQGIIDTMPQGVVLLDKHLQIFSANWLGQDALMTLAGLRIGDELRQLGDLDMNMLFQQSAIGRWHEIVINSDSEHKKIFEVVGFSQSTNDVENEWVLLVRDVTDEREIQQRLQQQHRLAAVGQLAAGISHDFNNILTILSMTLEIIDKTEPDLKDDNRNRLRASSKQVERGAKLIRQVLDFSRNSNPTFQSLDLVPFVGEMVKMIDRVLPESIDFTFDHDSSACYVTADPSQLQQVLMNLIINARDAMPTGGQLSLKLQPVNFELPQFPPFPEMVGKSWMKIGLTDEGIGIPPDIQEHIFEPFFTTKDRQQGTGLGLAQVYGIVRQNGGFIDVESVEGSGTTFSIYWPITDQLLAGPPVMPDQTLYSQPNPGNGKTLLIVEDEEEVRQATAQIFRQLDYRVVEAANGQDAIKVLEMQPERIELVITDMVMPGINGVELCHWIKQHIPGVEVILLTGYDREVSSREINNAGFAKTLEKPVTVQILADTVYNTLHQDSVATQWVDTNHVSGILPTNDVAMVPHEQSRLHLYVVGTENPLIFSGDRILVLGRCVDGETNADDGLVDLTPYQAKGLGVSRRHARIQRKEAQYYVEDLGSRNGTQLNGHRLNPHQQYALRPGDCLTVGELMLFIYFLLPKNDSTITAVDTNG